MRLSSLILLSLCCMLTACTSPASPQENAILSAAQQYLKANSAPTVGETNLKVEEVAGGYARVSVTPVKPTADPAVMYLRQTANGQVWEGVTLGTAWSPEDFEQLHIPQEVRE